MLSERKQGIANRLSRPEKGRKQKAINDCK
jgi:hypothetical protein